MGGRDQHFVAVQGQRVFVKLRFRVEVVVESLPLHPCQEPPLRRRDVTGRASPDHVGGLDVFRDMVDRFRAVEG